MADNQGTQEGEHSSFILRAIALPYDPANSPPETQVGHRVKIYEGQPRCFTYLKTDSMTPQQYNLPATTIYTTIPGRSGKPGLDLKQVPRNITMDSGVEYSLREVELERLSSFATQTSGCNIVYVEDRSAVPYLGGNQRSRATMYDATLVRKDAVLSTASATLPNE